MQVLSQLSQRITKLAAKTRRQTDPVPLQSPTGSPQDQQVLDGALLNLLEQMAHQGQRQLMFPGETTPLTGNDRLVSESSPATVTFHPSQQRWMRLERLPGRTGALESQTDNRLGTIAAGRLSSAWRLPQKSRETPLLIIELKIAMRRPQPLRCITVTIQPSLAATTQPAAQQTIGESVVGRRGVTHSPTLRLPTARSTEVQAVPWHRLPSP